MLLSEVIAELGRLYLEKGDAPVQFGGEITYRVEKIDCLGISGWVRLTNEEFDSDIGAVNKKVHYLESVIRDLKEYIQTQTPKGLGIAPVEKYPSKIYY